jgi:hypothetical protein
MKNNLLTWDEAKEIDLVDYLSLVRDEPVKIRNSNHWYLRNEKEASFKVNSLMIRIISPLVLRMMQAALNYVTHILKAAVPQKISPC